MCSGSTTSTRIGPTLVASRRSTGARAEANTLVCCCSPPVTTQNAASTTWRLGYRPIAAAKYTEPSRVTPLKK